MLTASAGTGNRLRTGIVSAHLTTTAGQLTWDQEIDRVNAYQQASEHHPYSVEIAIYYYHSCCSLQRLVPMLLSCRENNSPDAVINIHMLFYDAKPNCDYSTSMLRHGHCMLCSASVITERRENTRRAQQCPTK